MTKQLDYTTLKAAIEASKETVESHKQSSCKELTDFADGWCRALDMVLGLMDYIGEVEVWTDK